MPKQPTTDHVHEFKTCSPGDLSSKSLSVKSRLTALFDVGKDLFAMTDMDELNTRIIELLKQHLSLRHCLILRWEGSKIIPVAHNIPDLPEDMEDWPVSRTIIREVRKRGVAIWGQAFQTKEPVIELAKESLEIKSISSVFCTPLDLQGHRGAVYADTPSMGGASFDEEDFMFLILLSRYIDLAQINAEKLDVERQAKRVANQKVNNSKFNQARGEIIGNSEALNKSFDRLQRTAGCQAAVMLRGERGTGKELFAMAAHILNYGNDKGKPFVAVNAAAIPRELQEAELFGWKRAAFTGAHENRTGLLEMASGGTFFLDEIGDMDLDLQAKLLRTLEDKTLRRLGDNKIRVVDFRFVCATNKDLEAMMTQQTFRCDLYDRISDIVIVIPPLRERVSDIRLLVNHLFMRIDSDKRFSKAALDVLMSYHWPGNIRELFKVVKRAEVFCDEDEIEPEDLFELFDPGSFDDLQEVHSLSGTSTGNASPFSLREVEKAHIKAVLDQVSDRGGTMKEAAKILGIGRSTLFDKIKKFGLAQPSPSDGSILPAAQAAPPKAAPREGVPSISIKSH